MSLLNSLSLQKFIELTDSLLDEMTGYVPDSWQSLVSDLEWSDIESIQTKEEMTKIIIELVQCPDSQKNNLMEKMFDSDKCEYLLNSLSFRKLYIAKALMKQHNATVKPVLSDFDWKVKWILGNSSSTIMKYPLIDLCLNTVFHKNTESENISVELTKAELDSFIKMLEESYNKVII